MRPPWVQRAGSIFGRRRDRISTRELGRWNAFGDASRQHHGDFGRMCFVNEAEKYKTTQRL